MTNVFIRETLERSTRGESSMAIEAEIREMQSQAEDCQHSPEAGRGKEQNLPWRQIVFQTPDLNKYEKIKFCLLV